MAVLGNIRKRSAFLIIIIALALFSFILMDVLQSGTFGSNANNIGSINGTDVDRQDFMRKVAQVEQQNQNTSNAQAMNSVWEQEIRKIVLGEQIENLGLGLGDKQVINEIKKNQFFAQNPQFLNEAGVFDEGKFREFVISIQNDQTNKQRWADWKTFENDVVTSYQQNLYYNLIKGAVYTTKAEGQFQYTTQNRKVDFDYVTVPYNTINDDEVKVSDDEILAYLKKHPKKYKSDNTRSIEYVFFENKPSETDEKENAKAMDDVLYGAVKFNNKTQTNDTIPAFKNIASTNLGEYINQNSDVKFDSTYLTKKDLPLEYQEQLFNLSNGEVFGPYVFNNHQTVSRMMGRKANASARASHILIGFEGAPNSQSKLTKEEAKAKAESLLAQAKANPSSFATLATENSEDPGSKANGGEYDNITPGQMVPTFNDFVFNNPTGSIGMVETMYGFHVIKINEKYDSVLLGTIAQSIEPSEATIDANFAKASKFEGEAASKNFADVAKSYNVEVTPAQGLKASDEFVATLGAQPEIIRWTFGADTNKGSVKRFDTQKGFVVAKLTNINETGLIAVETARQSVGQILMNEKKAVKIREKMKGTTLDEVAKATGGSVIPATNVVIANAAIPNVGQEPKVVGTAYRLEQGKVSDLIDGNSGVFKVSKKQIVKETEMTNFTNQINQTNQQQQNAAQMRVYQVLKDKANIEDNRMN